MRELLLVSLSALVGYIVFSAFSTSKTPQEAFQKIIEQPHENRQTYQEVASTTLQNKHQEKLIRLENERKLAQLQVYSKLEIQDKENSTKVELKKLNNDLNHKLAILKIKSEDKDTSKNNTTLIILALLLFLLLFIYLRHKKYLNELELEKQDKYDEMMAKKEYAEKILAHISSGNLSFQTEKKLLAILDELNGKTIQPLNKTEIYHPNPDIVQLPHNKEISS